MTTLNAGEGKVSKIGPYQAKISGNAVAGLVIEFQQEFRDVYGYDVMASPLCAVGPLQTMIGLAIHKGLLVAPDAYETMPETGEASQAWNKREFVAKHLCRAEGKNWDRIPNVSTLWFRDRMHYRALADRAMSAARLWETCRAYSLTPKDPNQGEKE